MARIIRPDGTIIEGEVDELIRFVEQINGHAPPPKGATRTWSYCDGTFAAYVVGLLNDTCGLGLSSEELRQKLGYKTARGLAPVGKSISKWAQEVDLDPRQVYTVSVRSNGKKVWIPGPKSNEFIERVQRMVERRVQRMVEPE